MDMIISIEHYESLVTQIKIDFDNLKKSLELLKSNVFDKKLILELCRNYSFLFKDIKYIEKFNQNFSEFEAPISVKLLKDLKEIKILLAEVKEFLIQLTF